MCLPSLRSSLLSLIHGTFTLSLLYQFSSAEPTLLLMFKHSLDPYPYSLHQHGIGLRTIAWVEHTYAQIVFLNSLQAD